MPTSATWTTLKREGPMPGAITSSATTGNTDNKPTHYIINEKKQFIILNHFVKQTQKTPKNEIEKAKRLLEEYKKRGDLHE